MGTRQRPQADARTILVQQFSKMVEQRIAGARDRRGNPAASLADRLALVDSDGNPVSGIAYLESQGLSATNPIMEAASVRVTRSRRPKWMLRTYTDAREYYHRIPSTGCEVVHAHGGTVGDVSKVQL